MKLKAWKIRDKETGKFSSGGTRAKRLWTKEGKTWTNIGHLKNHLNQWISLNGTLQKDYPYHNAEIVEIEIDYEECFVYSVDKVINDMKEQKLENNKKQKEAFEKWEEERDRKKLAELLKKFGG